MFRFLSLGRRLRLIDVTEGALKVVGQTSEGSVLEQYATELERSGRLGDLLSEEGSEQLTELMKMARAVHVHVRQFEV